MMKSFFFTIFILLFMESAFSDNPVPMDGFTVHSLDPTVNLLSGMVWTSDGLVVCDRSAGTLLLIHNDQSTEVIIDQLDTPVDVMEYQNQWLILQEIEGSLIAVDKETLHRRTIAGEFIHPTAFTIDDNNTAYITEFETGFLFKIDLESGETERIPVMFDRPADVLFVKPDLLYIADQVGADLQAGTVVTINRSGKLLRFETDIIDPTGLALSHSGEIYVSTFSIRDSSSGNRMQSFNGGVVCLSDHHISTEIVSGLLGPTSILFDDEGNLIVLEEPTDSIYRFSSSGERTPILEGFAPVMQAARNNNGDIYAIENTPLHQIKIRKQDGFISSWGHSFIKMWDRVKMAVDGPGYVYISEPMFSRILVYDQTGNQVHAFDNIFPFYMMGIPTGGIFVFTLRGNSFALSLLKAEESIINIPIELDNMFTTGFARSDDQLVLCFANGEIQEFSLGTNQKKRINPGHKRVTYLSSAPDKNNENAFWLLDSNYNILFWDGNELIPAAQATEPGILLAASNGVLFIGNSGKRFPIQPETSAISGWNLY